MSKERIKRLMKDNIFKILNLIDFNVCIKEKQTKYKKNL